MKNKNYEQTKTEIEHLKIHLDFLRFEQNHIASDYFARIANVYAVGVPLFLIIHAAGFYVFGLIFFTMMEFMALKYFWDLKKHRDKQVFASLKVHAEIMHKYDQLGIGTRKFSNWLYEDFHKK